MTTGYPSSAIRVLPGQKERASRGPSVRGTRTRSPQIGVLEIQATSTAEGWCVTVRGDLVGETVSAVGKLNALIESDPRITMDLSGVDTMDQIGLESISALTELVVVRGGRLFVSGCDLALRKFTRRGAR